MKKPTFGNKVLEFYKTLTPPHLSLKEIKVIQPYEDQEVQGYMEKFFNKFFQDIRKRVFVFGINPGRFGSGATGIPFTDPVALENICDISNRLVKRREISSEFIYRFIEHWGGARVFYRDFFLTAISPIGFIRNGVNCNYYDHTALFRAVKPFIVDTLTAQCAFGARENMAIVLGSGKNQKIFNDISGAGCLFAAHAARDPAKYEWRFSVSTVEAVRIEELIQSAIYLSGVSTQSIIFPSVMAREDLKNLLLILKETPSVFLEQEEQFADAVCLGYRVNVGDLKSWMTGFGSFDFFPKTRQAVFTEIVFRTKPRPDYDWVMKEIPTGIIHLADMDMSRSIGVMERIDRA